MKVLVFRSDPPGLPTLWNIPLNLTTARPLNIFSTLPTKTNLNIQLFLFVNLTFIFTIWDDRLHSSSPTTFICSAGCEWAPITTLGGFCQKIGQVCANFRHLSTMHFSSRIHVLFVIYFKFFIFEQLSNWNDTQVSNFENLAKPWNTCFKYWHLFQILIKTLPEISKTN